MTGGCVLSVAFGLKIIAPELNDTVAIKSCQFLQLSIKAVSVMPLLNLSQPQLVQ
jgi:hypothetical protein